MNEGSQDTVNLNVEANGLDGTKEGKIKQINKGNKRKDASIQHFYNYLILPYFSFIKNRQRLRHHNAVWVSYLST
jgi:hypothetical protein